GVPALNNPGFYQELLLEPDGKVRPFWKPVLPDPDHALITVRMDPGASLADVQAVVDRVQHATGGPASRVVPTSAGQQVTAPTTAGELAGTRFTVTGTPAVAAELAAAVRQSLAFAVSTVPLVRQFALLMAMGVAASFLASVLVGLPVLSIVARRAGHPRASTTTHARGTGAPSWERLALVGQLPRPVVLPFAVVGLLGWAALPFVHVETDPVRLLPPGSGSIGQAEHVRQATGPVGELDL